MKFSGRLPRIRAVATANPARVVRQPEALELAGYKDKRRRGFFLNADVETRYLYLGESFRPGETVDELTARYQKGVVEIGSAAARRALQDADMPVGQVDFLATTSCTGRMCPDLDAALIRNLGLPRTTQRAHIGNTGCASAMVALQQAARFVVAHPGTTALAVASEICSATYYLDDSLECAVAHAIFGDGAGAVVVADDGPGAEILGFTTHWYPEHWDKMGYHFLGGYARINLSKEVRHIGGPILRDLGAAMLKEQALTKESIAHWVLHSGGRRVVESAQALLGLPDDAVAPTRAVLRRYGNMSSATVLFVLKEVWSGRVGAGLAPARPRPGDYGLMAALGPGFAAEGAVLRWTA